MSTPEQSSRSGEAILAVRIPVHLRDAIRAEAELNHRSMSGQVRWVIERHLAELKEAA